MAHQLNVHRRQRPGRVVGAGERIVGDRRSGQERFGTHSDRLPGQDPVPLASGHWRHEHPHRCVRVGMAAPRDERQANRSQRRKELASRDYQKGGWDRAGDPCRTSPLPLRGRHGVPPDQRAEIQWLRCTVVCALSATQPAQRFDGIDRRQLSHRVLDGCFHRRASNGSFPS